VSMVKWGAQASDISAPLGYVRPNTLTGTMC